MRKALPELAQTASQGLQSRRNKDTAAKPVRVNKSSAAQFDDEQKGNINDIHSRKKNSADTVANFSHSRIRRSRGSRGMQ